MCVCGVILADIGGIGDVYNKLYRWNYDFVNLYKFIIYIQISEAEFCRSDDATTVLM